MPHDCILTTPRGVVAGLSQMLQPFCCAAAVRVPGIRLPCSARASTAGTAFGPVSHPVPAELIVGRLPPAVWPDGLGGRPSTDGLDGTPSTDRLGGTVRVRR